MSAPRCPDCELAAIPDTRYCERCGCDLAGAPPVRWLVSGECRDLDLDAVAGVTDRGRHRQRNEDALAIGLAGRATAAVVCDGVSTSTRPERAALAAVEAGIRALLSGIAAGLPPAAATRSGVLVAAVAVAGQAGEAANPPSCTYVSAVVTADSVVVGWVGDSPAYWVGGGNARRLTVDDSVAGKLAANGVPPDDPRFADPRSYALQRWLGADAAPVAPQITALQPAGPGLVVVCSDGMSRSLAAVDGELREAADPTGTPALAARRLLRRALDAGGHDNITVAALAFPPPEVALPLRPPSHLPLPDRPADSLRPSGGRTA